MSLKMKNLLNIESELFNVTLWSSDRQLYFYKLLTLIFRIVVSENAWMLWPRAKSLGLLLSFLQSVKDKNSWKKLMLHRCFVFVTLKPVNTECHWKLANQTKQFISLFIVAALFSDSLTKGQKCWLNGSNNFLSGIFIFATLYVCDALKKMSWFFPFLLQLIITDLI